MPPELLPPQTPSQPGDASQEGDGSGRTRGQVYVDLQVSGEYRSSDERSP